MSGMDLYRRALARFAIGLILTVVGGMSCLLALYNAFRNKVMFALILFLILPLTWKLINIWQHTLSDLRLIQGVVACTESERG